ncbi:MAG: hypothetical protein JSV50_03460 [Desulfobacteraceae bacterium]|nr:MAG: hypothetical protein JSV50_03460 [Desulfobacteraceae bacterium]
MALTWQQMLLPFHIYGIDFSGAKDAGNKIWISKGTVKGEKLLIEDCFRASDIQGSGNDRERCIDALKDFVGQNEHAAFGFDFPFGLPEKLVKQGSWEDFINAFPGLYKDPEDFKRTCFSNAGGRELKRVTDIESQTPFSPYNLRLYKQTYYGILKILRPTVRNKRACVLPMQEPLAGKPWILEICPASTLIALELYISYKGRTDEHRANRGRILNKIEKTSLLQMLEPGIYETVLEDKEGNGIDSVIAATATFRALKKKAASPKAMKDSYSIEGYVYA